MQREVDYLNEMILRNCTGTFRVWENGKISIGLGPDKGIPEMLQLVQECGKEIEQGEDFSSRVQAIIQEGIRMAEMQIRLESATSSSWMNYIFGPTSEAVQRKSFSIGEGVLKVTPVRSDSGVVNQNEL